MQEQDLVRNKVISTIRTMEPRLADVGISNLTRLADLQLSSLQLIELGALLEEEFGGRVTFEEWLETERATTGGKYTLESLVTFIARAA